MPLGNKVSGHLTNTINLLWQAQDWKIRPKYDALNRVEPLPLTTRMASTSELVTDFVTEGIWENEGVIGIVTGTILVKLNKKNERQN